MKESSLNQIIETALGKIRSVADSNTVIGEPIRLSDEVVALPFSKVSVGFAAGGADYVPKHGADPNEANFAGGNGAGVSVTPLGFVIVKGTEVELVNLSSPTGDDPVVKALENINLLAEKIPEMIAKHKEKKRKKKEQAAEEKAEQAAEEKAGRN